MRVDNHWLWGGCSSWPGARLSAIVNRFVGPRGLFIGQQSRRVAPTGPASLQRALQGVYRVLPGRYAAQVEHCLWHLYFPVSMLLAPAMVSALSEMLYAECVLYHDPRDIYYRDHIVHPVRIALLGDHLLRARITDDPLDPVPSWGDLPLDGRVVDRVVDQLRSLVGDEGTLIGRTAMRLGVSRVAVDRDLVLVVWWLAGLFHDIGRPYQQLRKLTSTVLETFSFLLGGGGVELKAAVQMLADELPVEFLRSRTPRGLSTAEVLTLGCSRGHAVASALLFLIAAHAAEDFPRLTPTMRFALGLAAEAIVRHDLDELDSDLGRHEQASSIRLPGAPFQESPLAFLLQLCDHIDLMRPQLHPVPHGTTEMRTTFQYRVGCSAAEVAISSKQLTVKFDLKRCGPVYREYVKKKVLPTCIERFGPGGRSAADGLFESVQLSV